MSAIGEILARVLNLFANSLVIILLARVILSWTYPNMQSSLVFWVWRLTEPILAPIRRFLPVTGRLDFSPWVALLLIIVARAVLMRFFCTWI